MTKNGKIPRHYISYDPNQSFLLPPDMSSWLPANHMVYFLINLLQATDLSAFDRSATSHRGRPRYHYQMLCGLLLYAYSQGVTSSRLIERKTIEEIPYRILAGNSHPDHNTIANFRKQYLPELSSVSTALLLKLQQARYLSLNLVSIDGTKLKANASIHQNITRENAWKRKKEIEQWIHQKLQEADRQDQEEDDRFDDQNPFLGIPSGSYANKTIEELTQEVNQWDHFLDQSKREYAKKGKLEQKRQEQEIRSTPLPPPEYVSNRTDPESRIMKSGSNHAWVQAFNVEVAVDSDHQFIVGVSVTQDCNDQYQLIPMLQKLKKQYQVTPKQLVADAGYCSEKNITALLKHQVEGFIATGRPDWMHPPKKKTETQPQDQPPVQSFAEPIPERIESIKPSESSPSPSPSDSSGSSTPSLSPIPVPPKENGYTHRLGYSLVETMKLKLNTPLGKAVYKKRGNLSESPFGFIRRVMKFNQFSLRGLQNVQGEANLLVLAYNLRKYYQLCHPVVVTPRKRMHRFFPWDKYESLRRLWLVWFRQGMPIK